MRMEAGHPPMPKLSLVTETARTPNLGEMEWTLMLSYALKKLYQTGSFKSTMSSSATRQFQYWSIIWFWSSASYRLSSTSSIKLRSSTSSVIQIKWQKWLPSLFQYYRMLLIQTMGPMPKIVLKIHLGHLSKAASPPSGLTRNSHSPTFTTMWCSGQALISSWCYTAYWMASLCSFFSCSLQRQVRYFRNRNLRTIRKAQRS